MPTLSITDTSITVELSAAEKVGAVHGDLTLPRSAIADVRVVEDAMGAVSGLRAPGYSLPGHAKVGTWRHHDGKDFVAVYAGRPAVEITLQGERYERLLLGIDDPQAAAAQLQPA